MPVLCLLALVVVAASVVPASAMTLAKSGQTACTIVTSRQSTAPEKTAAKELQSYLRQVTGAEFPIKLDSDVAPGARRILVGQSAQVKKLLPDVDWKSLSYDGILIRTVGDDLILAGGRPRGTFYAVYTFLEDTVGCRWWTSTETRIPRLGNLEIGELNTQFTPKMNYREAYYTDTNENPLFALKLKLNGRHYNIPKEYGGHRDFIGWVHTFHLWIPPKKYFDKHPEWFSMVGGKRVGDKAQLCLTNMELVDEMARVCCEAIKKDPSLGMVSVSQNDWVGKCECEKCKAIEDREGSPSGPIVYFVNAVAEKIEKQYPEVLVETLAYLYSRKPPATIKPRDNVLIRLCSIDCNFAQPYNTEANKAFRDDILKWASISKNLCIWDYVTNFGNSIPPQANMRIIAPNLRFFQENHAIGIFEQGDAECSVGDFVRYRTWMLGHLIWDPYQDENKLKMEFLNGYYGAAGPYISRYFDVIHDAVARDNAAFGCIHGNINFWNLDDLTQAKRLLDKAEKAVSGDPELLTRVQRDRMPLDLMWLQRYNELKQTAVTNNVPFEGPADPVAASRDFIRRVKLWKVKGIGCGQTGDVLVKGLEAAFPSAAAKSEEGK